MQEMHRTAAHETGRLAKYLLPADRDSNVKSRRTGPGPAPGCGRLSGAGAGALLVAQAAREMRPGGGCSSCHSPFNPSRHIVVIGGSYW